jgi:hypothetical protein
VVVGGIGIEHGIQGNCHLEHLTLRQAKWNGVNGQSSFTVEDVLVEQCAYSGVVAEGTGVVGRCTNVEVCQCGGCGVFAFMGGSITLIGAKTTVHHNCTHGNSGDYGMVVHGSSSTIQLISPLTKETVSIDNAGGGNWGAAMGAHMNQIKTIADTSSPASGVASGETKTTGTSSTAPPESNGVVRDKYVGTSKDGKRHGQGTSTCANGDKYVGAYKDDKQHGEGTFTWDNGDKYVGAFKDGKKHGQGTFTWADGGKYVGEYKDNEQHGQGTHTWAVGNKYVGAWKEGDMNGEGTFIWAAGHKYVGAYKDNKHHGQGTQTWADGRKYVGAFKDDNMHGQGTYTWPNGDKYVGAFKDGKKHGQGTITFADGSKYVGAWKDGNRHGQ